MTAHAYLGLIPCSLVCDTLGRLLITHEAPLTAGFGAEIAAGIQEACFDHLEAPIARICGVDTPFPLAFEKLYLPDELKVFDGIMRSVQY